MINKVKTKIPILIFLISLVFINSNHNAAEILIYADDIAYDEKSNIIAKGKAKILYKDRIISSDLIIYSQENGNITLPLKFSLKDERNNFYYGESGFFNTQFDTGSITDVKVLLTDGSRIVGKHIKRNGNIDIISKGVYSPCESRIKIANFLCPIWQLEGEKMLHNYDNLFLYQKHSKMKILNVPIFYSPYLVTPSPLRKKRKSGFLTPSINLNFFDTNISQATSLPYYFNIDIDKELTLTPTINYGGGVDSSQRFNFDYNQIFSGGEFNSKLTFDTTFENQNNEKWLKEGSIINNYKQNINEKFKMNFSSTLQTSKNYIQQTNPNDELSYSSSLNTKLNVFGYSLRNEDDTLNINLSNYQSNQNDEDNKTLPTILPYITYYTGTEKYKKYNYNNTIETYNIFRNGVTDIHSKNQQKLSSRFLINRNLIKYGTKIDYGVHIYNQFFKTKNKKINGTYRNSDYFRSFPIFGIKTETPFRLKNNFKKLIYTPMISFIAAPGLSNSEKLSNEDSSINSYTIQNNTNFNRFTGTDKLDNSKRVNLSLSINNENFYSTLWTAYEFTNNSNYHYSQGNEKKLSDFLGEFNLKYNNSISNYNFRFDPHENYMKSQNYTMSFENSLGEYKLSYLDQKSKTDGILSSDKESLNYRIESKKIKFSKISYFGLYDLKNSINTESGISYSYFDECFGVNIDFKRNSYAEEELKPQDIMTIMFSFKNLGSYKSTNLAVSENDKQDIEWEGGGIDNDLFN